MPSITITLTAEQAARLQTAFSDLGDQNPPTLADLKRYIIGHLRDRVLQKERAIAEAALASPPPFDPT